MKRRQRCAAVVRVLTAACRRKPQRPGRDRVASRLSAADSPYQADVKALRLPPALRHLNHFSYGIALGKDRMLYIGIGDNRDIAHLLRFDPATEVFSDLGNIREALPASLRHQGNFGKVHTGPHQTADGSIYFATYASQYWDGPQSGRLFRYSDTGGLEDLGATPNNQNTYFMHGDDAFGRLYFTTRNCHFLVYDLVTGRWQDKGRFTSKAPFIGLTDVEGRLYVYGHDGHGDWKPGPATITRYDPASDTLLTSKNAPPSLWVGAVTPDQRTAYTTSYKRAEIFMWRFDEWPNFTAREIGRIDPQGRDVFSNNLSYLPAANSLLLAGTIDAGGSWFRGNIHALWLYEIATGRRCLVARLDETIAESFGTDPRHLLIYWNNANTVGDDGWVYIGIQPLEGDASSEARLVAVRVQRRTY